MNRRHELTTIDRKDYEIAGYLWGSALWIAFLLVWLWIASPRQPLDPFFIGAGEAPALYDEAEP